MSVTTSRHVAAPHRKSRPASLKRHSGWSPRGLVVTLKATVLQWSDDKVPKLAAALAYYTSFAIAPILLISIAILGLIFGADAARGSVSRQISGLVGNRVGEGIESLLKSAWQPKTGVLATILGIIALVFGASGVFGELQDSLNIIWKVKKKPGRGLWGTIRDRFFSFGMVLGIGFILLVSLVLSAVLEALGNSLIGWAGGPMLLQGLNQGLSFAVVAAVFGSIFKILPDARTRWRDVWVGAILTAGLFTLGKYVIGLYLGKSAVASTFGAAGSFVILLLWIYYSSQIFFFGAEFTKAYADLHGPPTRPDSDAVAVAVTTGAPGSQARENSR